MKKYLVFTGDNYYPSGGMNDFFGDFDTFEEIQEALQSLEWWFDWKQVWDTETRQDVTLQFEREIYER